MACEEKAVGYLPEAVVTEIRDLLHDLGLAENSIGFYYIEDAVHLALEDPTRLLLVTKELYPETARKFRTSWQTVERGIRYSIGKIWTMNQAHLQEVLGITTERKPVPSTFLSLLCARLRRRVLTRAEK